MGKVGERGEVARWERWLRGVRWLDGKGGGESSISWQLDGTSIRWQGGGET